MNPSKDAALPECGIVPPSSEDGLAVTDSSAVFHPCSLRNILQLQNLTLLQEESFPVTGPLFAMLLPLFGTTYDSQKSESIYHIGTQVCELFS